MMRLFDMLEIDEISEISELYILEGAVIVKLNNNKDDHGINDYQMQSK
jgi:hypothetical protein